MYILDDKTEALSSIQAWVVQLSLADGENTGCFFEVTNTTVDSTIKQRQSIVSSFSRNVNLAPYTLCINDDLR